MGLSTLCVTRANPIHINKSVRPRIGSACYQAQTTIMIKETANASAAIPNRMPMSLSSLMDHDSTYSPMTGFERWPIDFGRQLWQLASDAANWAATSGGAGRQTVPSAADRATIDVALAG
jgi:hypothetical protein